MRKSRKKVAVDWSRVLDQVETGVTVELIRPPHLTIFETRDEVIRVARFRGLEIDWQIILGHLDILRKVPEAKEEPMERLKLMLNLKALRMEAEVSLETVEQASGVSIKSYRVVEGGATPSLETALKIARFLALPVEEIWGLEVVPDDEQSLNGTGPAVRETRTSADN